MPAPATSAPGSAPTLASRALPRRVKALLEGILEYASDELQRVLSDTLDDFEQQIFKYAEQARSSNVQTRWLEAQRLVKRGRPDLVPRMLIALEAELATVREGDPPRGVSVAAVYRRGELALVEHMEIDETTALTEVASRTEVRNSLPLYLMGQRFGVLCGRPAFDAETLPVGPHALCRMIRDASGCLELSGEHRLLLFRTFERNLAPVYGSLVEALNSYLSRQGVLPHLQYVPVRARPLNQASPAPERNTERRAPPGGGDNARPTNPAADTSVAIPAASSAGSQAEDAFQMMRQLLSGRRQLLGKLGNARTAVGESSQVAQPEDLQRLLGSLQHKPPTNVKVGDRTVPRGIGHLKQDLMAQLRTLGEGAAPPALAEEDSDAIDLVGMLYDHIMRDVKPNSPAANLLSKLQVPLLRVALQDRAFFTRQQHPARQMLNAIAETGVHWLGDDAPDDGLVQKMQSLVDRTVRDFDGDMGLFNNLLEDLTSHLQLISRKAEVAEKRHVEAARGKEKLALARQRAASVVDDLLRQQNLPRFTHTLLSQAWTDVMALTSLRQGEDSDSWRHHIETAERLIALAKAPPGQAPINAEQADALRQEVQAALVQVGYHEDESTAISQRLVDPQSANNEEDPASRTELTMRLKARAKLGSGHSDIKARVARLSADEQARLEQVKHLPFGTWFEFISGPQGDKVRRRLSWFSTVTGHVLFVNHRGQKTGELTLDALARAMSEGQVRVVEEEKGTMIDRAWGAVMNALRSFAGQGKPEAPAR